MRIGLSALSNLKLGTADVSRVYYGNSLVWQRPPVGGTFPETLGLAAWFRMDEPLTLWRDIIGSLQASAFGHALARIDDGSGNSRHATQSTAASQPRLAKSSRGGRRNLCRNSIAFNIAGDAWSANWTATSATSVQLNAGIAPDGTNTANKIVEGVGNPPSNRGWSIEDVSAFVPVPEPCVISVYAKAAERTAILLQGKWTNGVASYGVVVDLINGTFVGVVEGSPGNLGGGAYNIENVGNDWWRISLAVWQLSNVGAIRISMAPAVGTAATHVGDGTSGVLVWGAQIERGFVLSPFERTISAVETANQFVPDVPFRFALNDGNDSLQWNAPAGTYTVGWVNPRGNISIQSEQSLSGATNMLLGTEVSEYLAIPRSLTTEETRSLRSYFLQRVGMHQTEDGLAIPDLSVPYFLFVARDINIAGMSWKARVKPGMGAPVLGCLITPELLTDTSWAPGVPVFRPQSNLFFGRLGPMISSAGYSMVAVLGGINQIVYVGPNVFSSSENRIQTIQRTSSEVRINTGGGGTGRFNAYTGEFGTFPEGGVLQFDKPVGGGTILSAFEAYHEGSLITPSTAGTFSTNSHGEFLALGGRYGSTVGGAMVPNAAGRVLAFLRTVGGTALSAEDRERVTEFMIGLRTGAIL